MLFRSPLINHSISPPALPRWTSNTRRLSIRLAQLAGSGHPEDVSKEDLVALDPGESVIVYRGFRDFVGPYVAHCHNLAHEDHAMMFGWEITP